MPIYASTLASDQLQPHGSVRQHDVRTHNGVLGCEDPASVSRITLAMGSIGVLIGSNIPEIVNSVRKQIEINSRNIRHDDEALVKAPG